MAKTLPFPCGAQVAAWQNTLELLHSTPLPRPAGKTSAPEILLRAISAGGVAAIRVWFASSAGGSRGAAAAPVPPCRRRCCSAR